MTDWSRVTRAVFRVRQHYRYTYSGPVWDMKQRLLMIPRDQEGDQRVLQHDLEIRGMEDGADVAWASDQFGNRVANVVVQRVPQAIDFEAIFQVERDATRPGARRPAPWPAELGPIRYLKATALTAPDSRLVDAAIQIVRSADDPRERADRAHDWASGSITYQYGVTGYTTPAAMALHFQKGVCQDFAHILLAVLRLANVPCRYVSGHMLGEGAPHAWVEALIADPSAPGEIDVIAYDPTHHRRARMDYITVATGRDFADVTPTSGTYGGPALGRLAYTKQAEIVELKEFAGVA
ncbi:MAG: transglutaminase family protein [Chloroflexota bacterium]|nr:transglutaminase family protein [Chloroflexota bacterium]